MRWTNQLYELFTSSPSPAPSSPGPSLHWKMSSRIKPIISIAIECWLKTNSWVYSKEWFDCNIERTISCDRKLFWGTQQAGTWQQFLGSSFLSLWGTGKLYYQDLKRQYITHPAPWLSASHTTQTWEIWLLISHPHDLLIYLSFDTLPGLFVFFSQFRLHLILYIMTKIPDRSNLRVKGLFCLIVWVCRG